MNGCRESRRNCSKRLIGMKNELIRGGLIVDISMLLQHNSFPPFLPFIELANPSLPSNTLSNVSFVNLF